MKNIFLYVSFAFSILSVKAQEKNDIVLTVVGQGKTLELAHLNALRSSLEQAFGVFISSKTEIINDKILDDEIVSISQGSVQSYKVISDEKLSDTSFVSILKVTMSSSDLVSYYTGKGMEVLFKGDVFAKNIEIQNLNYKNEWKSWLNTRAIILKLMQNGYNYALNVSSPSIIGGNYFQIGIEISIAFNKNYDQALTLLFNYLNAVNLTNSEVENFKKISMPFYTLNFANKNLRSDEYGYYDKYFNLSGFKNKSMLSEYYIRNPYIKNDVYNLPWIFAKQAINGFKLIYGDKSKNITELINSERSQIQIGDFNSPFHIKSSDRGKTGIDLLGGNGFLSIHSWQSDRWNGPILNSKNFDVYYGEQPANPYFKNKSSSILQWIFSNVFPDSEINKESQQFFSYPYRLGNESIVANFLKEKSDFLKFNLNFKFNVDQIKNINSFKIETDFN